MINIREVKTEDINAVSTFILATMQEVYPFPLSKASRNDLDDMEKLFINRRDATIMAAFLNDKVVGTIAVRPYDGRIVSLKDRYQLATTCEIIKCYVDQHVRQQGIGSLLFERTVDYCKQKNYKTMYLHTHRFLPGGLTFWRKKGFQIILDERGSLQTVHMEQEVNQLL
ncbi:GNAT family N-acetyltransferase [Halalkalibacter alkalisediminis]|uniref:GNAT family N-acetyltransferase n=1 Tax=Halalkalibacter alkalisediminis TaxID=935616 RepID=A0ABV6NEJ4_9BACI|nr:GNAT family N-acetyltransferase [Halalkalibacter alkalisediminis]